MEAPTFIIPAAEAHRVLCLYAIKHYGVRVKLATPVKFSSLGNAIIELQPKHDGSTHGWEKSNAHHYLLHEREQRQGAQS